MAKPKTDLDVLASLSKASFRDVPFDVVAMRMNVEQDHAAHLFPDRDAGIIEATGRKPVGYSFTAIFRNGVLGFTDQPYPGQWRKFVAACADRSTATLTHPELGDIRAKCQSCVTSWEPSKRDGVDVEVSFIEASGLEDDLLTQLAKLGSTPYSAARDFDSAAEDLGYLPDFPDDLKPSLLESLKRLNGAIAQFKLGLGNITATIDGYASAIGDLRDQIASIDDPKNYKMLDALDRLFGSLLDLGQTVTAKARPTTLAIVPFTQPVSAVAGFFHNSIDDFLRLNPLLASRTKVLVGTPVLVYIK